MANDMAFIRVGINMVSFNWATKLASEVWSTLESGIHDYT